MNAQILPPVDPLRMAKQLALAGATSVAMGGSLFFGAGCDEPGSVARTSGVDRGAASIPTPTDLDEYDVGVKAAVEAELASLRAAINDPDAWERLGDLYLAHDRPGLAIECYSGSLRLDANRARTRRFRSIFRRNIGRSLCALYENRRALQP